MPGFLGPTSTYTGGRRILPPLNISGYNRRVGNKHKSRGLYVVYAGMSVGWKLNHIHPTYTRVCPMDHPAYTTYIPHTCMWDVRGIVRGIVRGMYVGCTRDCTKLNRVHHVHPRTSADMSAELLLLAYPPDIIHISIWNFERLTKTILCFKLW